MFVLQYFMRFLFYFSCLILPTSVLQAQMRHWGVQVGAGVTQVQETDETRLSETKMYTGNFVKIAGFYNFTGTTFVTADVVATVEPLLTYIPVKGSSTFVNFNLIGSSLIPQTKSEKISAFHEKYFRMFAGLGLQQRMITRFNPQSDEAITKRGEEIIATKGEETEEIKLRKSLRYFTSNGWNVAAKVGVAFDPIWLEINYTLAKSLEGNFIYEFYTSFEIFAMYTVYF